ncbi:MAG: Sec-independent protein translocase subunit TatA/TatB [Myxococcota bacterium]
MLNIGAGEIVLILAVALLILGPKRLPELARGIGKFLREFRRQTDEVRSVVEREFYRMDQEIEASPTPALPKESVPAQATAASKPEEPPASEVTAPLVASSPVAAEGGGDLYFDEKDYPHAGEETELEPSPQQAAAAPSAPQPAPPAGEPKDKSA